MVDSTVASLTAEALAAADVFYKDNGTNDRKITGQQIADGVMGLGVTTRLKFDATQHQKFTLGFSDYAGNTIPVVSFRPTENNLNIALDVQPKGTAPTSISGYGYAWLDVCDKDYELNPLVAGCCLHFANRSDWKVVSSRAYNSGTKLPLVLGIGDDTDVTPAITIATDSTTTINKKLTLATPTTAAAPLKLTVGSAPTTPADGDMWLESNTNTGLKIRIAGVTKTVTLA